MPSTYSTNLKLQLMATGEDSGTWGVNTNNNLGTLIEESIVGAATVAMADANQTITTPDGVTGSGRHVYLNCTGALTANRNLVVPTLNKNYVVTNSTTGGFSIVVKTTAGTGITIGPALKRYVYADGTNVVEAINSVGDFTVAGTLGISSVSTTGNATIGGNLAVTGTTALTGNATMAGTVGVTGAVTGASFNKTAITAPATGSTLSIADGKTFTASNTLTLTGTDNTAMTFPGTSGTVVTLDATQTLTNKTLTSPTINTPTINTATINTATINTGSMGAASTATTQTAGDNSTKLATTAYVDTAATNTAYVTMKVIGAFPFSFSYTPRRSTSILTIEVDIPSIGGSNTTNSLTVTVGASTLNTAFIQFTNLAYHASPFRVIGTYQVASAAALTIGSALTGGGTLTGSGTVYMRVTESYGVIS